MAVVIIENNGRLMKPQSFNEETGELTEWVDNPYMVGSTQEEKPFQEDLASSNDWTEEYWFDDYSAEKKAELIKKSNVRSST